MNFQTCLFLLLCIAATAFAQLRPCRMQSVRVKVTQRVCQRSCLPMKGQSVVCATARAGQIVSICPSYCCRMGNSCRSG